MVKLFYEDVFFFLFVRNIHGYVLNASCGSCVECDFCVMNMGCGGYVFFLLLFLFLVWFLFLFFFFLFCFDTKCLCFVWDYFLRACMYDLASSLPVQTDMWVLHDCDTRGEVVWLYARAVWCICTVEIAFVGPGCCHGYL